MKNNYHDVMIAAAFKAGKQLPHWKLARVYFEEAINEMCELDKQHWAQQQDDDAVNGNLGEWTDE